MACRTASDDEADAALEVPFERTVSLDSEAAQSSNSDQLEVSRFIAALIVEFLNLCVNHFA